MARPDVYLLDFFSKLYCTFVELIAIPWYRLITSTSFKSNSFTKGGRVISPLIMHAMN